MRWSTHLSWFVVIKHVTWSLSLFIFIYKIFGTITNISWWVITLFIILRLHPRFPNSVETSNWCLIYIYYLVDWIGVTPKIILKQKNITGQNVLVVRSYSCSKCFEYYDYKSHNYIDWLYYIVYHLVLYLLYSLRNTICRSYYNPNSSYCLLKDLIEDLEYFLKKLYVKMILDNLWNHVI